MYIHIYVYIYVSIRNIPQERILVVKAPILPLLKHEGSGDSRSPHGPGTQLLRARRLRVESSKFGES